MDQIRILQKNRWNRIHADYNCQDLKYDNWLDMFEDEIKTPFAIARKRLGVVKFIF